MFYLITHCVLPNRHEWQLGRVKYLPPFPARPPRVMATRTNRRFRRCKP